MGCVIGIIHYVLKVLFCFRHFTAFHNHHYARLLMGIDHLWMFVECHVEVCVTCCLSFRLHFILIAIYGVICVQLAHCNIGDWKDVCIAYVIIIIKSEVSTFHIVIIFFTLVVCLRCLLHHILLLLHIHSGITGNLFSLLLCSLWWVQIVGHVLAWRSYSFICTLYHLIIIIVQTYLKTLNS